MFLPLAEEDFEAPLPLHQHLHPHPHQHQHQQHKHFAAPSTPSHPKPRLSLQRGSAFDFDVPPTPSFASAPNKFSSAPRLARKVLHQDSPEEYQKVVNDKKFSDFLRIKSLFVERALDQTDSCDIIKDYTSKMKVLHKTSKTFNVLMPYEENSLRGRPVMSLQWSPLIPELFLATYGAKVPTSANNKNALNLTNPAVGKRLWPALAASPSPSPCTIRLKPPALSLCVCLCVCSDEHAAGGRLAGAGLRVVEGPARSAGEGLHGPLSRADGALLQLGHGGGPAAAGHRRVLQRPDPALGHDGEVDAQAAEQHVRSG